MIEDYAKPTDTQPLSSIPLQFLVYVFNSNEACDERPDFTEETRAKGSCIGIPPGGTYFDRIIVRAGGPSKRYLITYVCFEVWFTMKTLELTNSTNSTHVFYKQAERQSW